MFFDLCLLKGFCIWDNWVIKLEFLGILESGLLHLTVIEIEHKDTLIFTQGRHWCNCVCVSIPVGYITKLGLISGTKASAFLKIDHIFHDHIYQNFCTFPSKIIDSWIKFRDHNILIKWSLLPFPLTLFQAFSRLFINFGYLLEGIDYIIGEQSWWSVFQILSIKDGKCWSCFQWLIY